LGHVFVAAAGQIDDDELVGPELGSAFDDFGDCVGGFEGGDDAFEAAECHEGTERFGIGGEGVFDAALIAEPGMLGANSGVVQAGGYAVSKLHLTEFVLQQVRAGALEDAERPALETGGVFLG